MRRDFADYLFEELKVNKDLFLITGDLGFNLFNKHIETFPERVLNPGSSEQLIMGMATGLALENKIPVDSRHNAKIHRLSLAKKWTKKVQKKNYLGL